MSDTPSNENPTGAPAPSPPAPSPPAPSPAAPSTATEADFRAILEADYGDLTLGQASKLARLWKAEGAPRDLDAFLPDAVALVKGANTPGGLKYTPKAQVVATPAEPAAPGRSNSGAPGTNPNANLGMPRSLADYKPGQFSALPYETRREVIQHLTSQGNPPNPYRRRGESPSPHSTRGQGQSGGPRGY